VLPEDMSDKFTAVLRSANILTPFIIDSSNKAEILKNLSLIQKENGLLRDGYAYLILGLIANGAYAVVPRENAGSELLSKLLLYVHENFNKNITLNSIAAAFGYHPAYISAYFKSRLDMCISRYINIIRLKNAVLLMKQNEYSITQIAYDCGFNSARTFYRAFNKEFGCSPKEYLKEMKI
jgi:AraC-like DNA-binding protein